jgi:hypothetical protein
MIMMNRYVSFHLILRSAHTRGQEFNENKYTKEFVPGTCLLSGADPGIKERVGWKTSSWEKTFKTVYAAAPSAHP